MIYVACVLAIVVAWFLGRRDGKQTKEIESAGKKQTAIDRAISAGNNAVDSFRVQNNKR
jgi:hypothetical protein